MGWDLEAMPAQETCEPAKYGGVSCSCRFTKLPSVLPHTWLLLGRTASLHTAYYGGGVTYVSFAQHCAPVVWVMPQIS